MPPHTFSPHLCHVTNNVCRPSTCSKYTGSAARSRTTCSQSPGALSEARQQISGMPRRLGGYRPALRLASSLPRRRLTTGGIPSRKTRRLSSLPTLPTRRPATGGIPSRKTHQLSGLPTLTPPDHWRDTVPHASWSGRAAYLAGALPARTAASIKC